MEHLTIRAFWAADEPGTCALFVREHARVLEDFGITNVPSNNSRWINSSSCAVIVAEHDSLGLVGGVRIETAWAPGETIPLIGSVGNLDPNVRKLVDQLAPDGLGELCGLWNANRFAGHGLPHVLGMVGISLANQIGVRSLTGLLAKYTLKYALRLGFRIFDEVGHSGIFDYPRPGFLGIVCGTTDSIAMEHARRDHRERIISLRLRPEQQAEEDTGTSRLMINYHLHLRQEIIDMKAYLAVREDRLRYTA